jgi:hypothetical protein
MYCLLLPCTLSSLVDVLGNERCFRPKTGTTSCDLLALSVTVDVTGYAPAAFSLLCSLLICRDDPALQDPCWDSTGSPLDKSSASKVENADADASSHPSTTDYSR